MPSVEKRVSDGELPLAVVAALKRELVPLGRKAHPNLALIETGAGAQNADRHLRWWLERSRTRGVIGIGFAGALSPSLLVGDLMVAREVLGGKGERLAANSALLISAAERLELEGLAVRFGTIITANKIAGESKDKRSLAMALSANEVGCVDIESSAIAKVCTERHIPFLIVRCITDVFDEDLPVDFNRCRNSDGDLNYGKVLKAALLNPRSFKGLWELRRRSQACAEQLALFVQRLLPLIKTDD
jgi:adenosylhomocysteine nucleosidase